MALIFQTGDIHLRLPEGDRWTAFKMLVQAAAEHAVNVMVISGHLFGSAIDAESLRAPLRSLFEDA